DVSDDIRRELGDVAEEKTRAEPRSPALPAPVARYEAILARHAPVAKTWAGPAFAFPRDLPEAKGVVLVTSQNAELLRPLLAGWLVDVPSAQPMLAFVLDGIAVAVCCSVRRTGVAQEAGVETVLSHRGRGYASRVVAAWGHAVR